MQFSISPGFRTADGTGAGFVIVREAQTAPPGKVTHFLLPFGIFLLTLQLNKVCAGTGNAS